MFSRLNQVPNPVKVLFYTRAVYTLPVVVGFWTFQRGGIAASVLKKQGRAVNALQWTA
jgi:hypothetical protein